MAVNYKELVERGSQALGSCYMALDDDSAYYEADKRVRALGTMMPPEMQQLSAAVGYSRLYLDSLVERIEVTGFRYPGSTEADQTLQKWWQINNLDQESSIMHLETFIHGRCYVTISAPSDEDILNGHPADIPIIRVESPRHMWVEIDPRTGRVLWALRVYKSPMIPKDEQGYTLYLPDETVYLKEDRSRLVKTGGVVHNLGVVPVVPSFNRERVSDRYGRSEIIPELRSMQDVATRLVMNMQAASELMAVPQRILFGIDPSVVAPDPTDPYAKYKAYMASVLAFQDEGRADQFSAAELSNYTTVLQEIAKTVAAYTGLPPQYLSFSSENPASAEAIRSAESRLVKKCELKGKMFGNTWEQVMRIGMKVMNDTIPEEAFQMQAILADPSTPTYAAKADAAMKLTGGRPIIPIERARIDMGYTPEDREDMRRMDEEENAELAAAMMGTPSVRFQLPTNSTQDNGEEGTQTSSSNNQ